MVFVGGVFVKVMFFKDSKETSQFKLKHLTAFHEWNEQRFLQRSQKVPKPTIPTPFYSGISYINNFSNTIVPV